MTGRKLRPDEVDRLLRETLRDEPAPEEDARLRFAMRRAWLETQAAGTPEKPARPARHLTGGSRVTRPLLGAVAGLVIASGLTLHLSLPPRLVADSLAAQNEPRRVAGRLRRAVGMECVLETMDAAGRLRRYHVEWRAPDEVRVRLEDPGGGIWLRRVPERRAGLIASPLGSSDSLPDDPRLGAVRDVLSPDRIAGLLDGRWDAVEDGAPASGGQTFDVAHPERRVRVTVDRATDLPVRLEAGWTAEMSWTLETTPLSLAGASPGAW